MPTPIDINTRNKIAFKLNQGKSISVIAQDLLVSRRSIGRIKDKIEKNQSLLPKHVDRTYYKNSNSKIDKNYIIELEKSIKEKPELTNTKRSIYLEDKTTIKISANQIRLHMVSMGVTKKKFSTQYYESKSPINQSRKKTFLAIHDSKSTKNKKDDQHIPLLLTCSTDESGWENDVNVKKGYGFIRKIPPIKKLDNRKTSGRSYRDNSSRLYKINLKHSKFKLNLIATICLDFENPVPYFEINEENTTGSIYANYISHRTLPSHVKYDIIDRHSTHRSTKSNIIRGDRPVKEIYFEQSIKEDFTPAGMPQFCPVESLFSYINNYMENKSIGYNDGSGWEKSDMIKIITESISKVTFKMVQGWYIRTFRELYQDRELPVFLRSDVSKNKIQNEILRMVKNYNKKENIKTTTRSGRVVKPKNFQ